MSYSRDIDIGKPTRETYKVEDMDTLVQKVKDTISQLEEVASELKKVATGIGFVVDEDIEEVASDDES